MVRPHKGKEKEMKKEVTVSPEKIAYWQKLVEDNEHSAVLWSMAKYFRESLEDAGCDKDACAFLEIEKQLKAIYIEHEETGSISSENYARRYRLGCVLKIMISAFSPKQADEINRI